jgi:hypothetical protein
MVYPRIVIVSNIASGFAKGLIDEFPVEELTTTQGMLKPYSGYSYERDNDAQDQEMSGEQRGATCITQLRFQVRR